MNDSLPDETTFCRFRNKLIDRNLIDKLLLDINIQLEKSGLKVKNCDGAIIDATVIESSARPRKVLEIVTEDRKEPDIVTNAAEVSYSHDIDAAWIKKARSIIMAIKGL